MHRFLLLALMPLFGYAASAQANDPVAGKEKAKACAVCHGPMGIATNPGAPHLAGQPAIYLIEQMNDFRSGRRKNPVMSVIAKPLSDQDISDISAWYASLVIEVKTP
jgi:cytochrome c553